jgi:hypothetical protein
MRRSTANVGGAREAFMRMPRSGPSDCRPTPIAACLAGIFAVAAAPAMATNRVVLNCSDAGADSLRATVGAANNGDTIDMTGLACGVITLTTGAITIPSLVSNLSLNGPGKDELAIVQFGTVDRIIKHQGSGTLFVSNLSVVSGYLSSALGNVFGGCIYSLGNVYLDHAAVASCTAKTQIGYAKGGGIYAAGDLTAKHSTISGNAALATVAGGKAVGGGAVANSLTAQVSTIANNSAVATASATPFGGGLSIRTNVSIFASTISGNTSSGDAGGLIVLPPPPPFGPYSITITNSTVSGNSAAKFFGGVYSRVAMTLQNSTIAFNTAAFGSDGSNFLSPGLAFNAAYNDSFLVNLQSSLISNNTYGSTPSDFSTAGDFTHVVTVSGENNLILAPATTPPLFTITGSCPLLGPLRDNGGETKTQALLSTSPAISAGNNALFLPYDQRGAPYARVSTVIPDIGAYEVDLNDVIFNSGFDGCPEVL